MASLKDVICTGVIRCLSNVYASKFIGTLQGTADKAKTLDGMTSSVKELNYVKGTTSSIQTQINNLTKAINDAKALRASLEAYGMTKVTNSSAVTNSTGLALAATEKNASIDGTLANQISQLNSDLDTLNIQNDLLTKYSIGLNMSWEQLISRQTPTFFTNWHDIENFPGNYGSGIMIPCLDADIKVIIYNKEGVTYSAYIESGNNISGWKKYIDNKVESIPITLVNGTTSVNGYPATILKIGNIVNLSGIINNDTAVKGTVLFTLPEGCRIYSATEFFCNTSGAVSNVGLCVSLYPDGNVVYMGADDINWSLGCISFIATN